MSGRSGNSVRDLLGKFEDNNVSTSPPSRGRSPAGSVTSNSSRPFSTVRTSFVSAAPSPRRPSSNTEGNMGGDGVSEIEAARNGLRSEIRANVNGIMSPPSKTAAKPVVTMQEEGWTDHKKEDEAKTTQMPVMNASNTDPDKPIPSVEDDSASLPAADSKDEQVFPVGNALGEKRQSLGNLLKGHAFEQEPIGKSDVSEVQKAAESSKPASQPKKVNLPQTRTSGPKEARSAGAALNAKSKGTSSRPSAIETKREPPSGAANLSKSPKTPHTAQDSDIPGRVPLSKTSSPRQPIPLKASSSTTDKDRKKGTVQQKPSRPSTVAKTLAKSHTAAIPNPGQTQPPSHHNPATKHGPTSPATKPRPKSPTRPVRLPASLTAPTAASVAKLGGGPPSRSPSRTSTTSTAKPSIFNKDRTPAGPSQLRHKPPRASLSATSDVVPKPKARVSTAGTKATDGGFLARMMRPTQSSASKTHEKVEHKTPPKKNSSRKPSRISGDGVEEEYEKGDSEFATVQQGYEVPSTDGMDKGINGDTPASAEAFAA